MLNTYTIFISPDRNLEDSVKGLDNLQYAFVMAEDYKDKYKQELDLPKGTRYNWFPLVLLHKYRRVKESLNKVDVLRIKRIFRKFYQNPMYRSFYVENVTREENVLCVTYRAGKNMVNEISKIATMYGVTANSN